MTRARPTTGGKKRWPYLGREIDYAEAVALQEEGRRRIVPEWSGGEPELVAGVDMSVRGGRARAAVVTYRFPELVEVEHATSKLPLDFPYIPGLLAFREVPAILAAFEKLRSRPDLLLVDGHGIAHPRRFGVACHVGTTLDIPALGVGKSRFVGEAREPARRRGSATRLLHEGEVIGRVVRTRDGVKPVFVSIGHRIDLAAAVRFTLASTRRYRLPEPIRAADRVAGALPV